MIKTILLKIRVNKKEEKIYKHKNNMMEERSEDVLFSIDKTVSIPINI